jgi:outer membrane murein-binding lipoprotein Lpp
MIAALASIGSAFTMVRVLAVVSVLGLLGGAYSGWKIRDWKADAEMNAAQVDWLQRQFEANTAAEQVNREMHDEHAAELAKLEEATNAITGKISAGVCFTSDDVDWLRLLWPSTKQGRKDKVSRHSPGHSDVPEERSTGTIAW